MEKVLNVTIKGEPHLIKYKTSIGGRGDLVYTVETTTLDLERFHFIIRNGKPMIFRTGYPYDEMKQEIADQIFANED